MGRKKTVKNPNVNDIQRERVLKKRIIEERAKAQEIWERKGSKTKRDKLIHYMEGKRIADHITSRILRGVVYGLKYGMSLYPKNPEEKYFDLLGTWSLSHLISRIRRNPDFDWFSIATEVRSENPDTKDLEYVCYDFRAEQEAQGKRRITKEHVELTTWKTNRQEIEDTKVAITDETVARAILTPEEYRKRKEEYRRKRNNIGEGEQN